MCIKDSQDIQKFNRAIEFLFPLLRRRRNSASGKAGLVMWVGVSFDFFAWLKGEKVMAFVQAAVIRPRLCLTVRPSLTKLSPAAF